MPFARQLKSVAYGNGTRTEYAYDAARRVTSIDHRRFTGMQYETMLKLDYTYFDNDLVASMDESDKIGWLAGVTYAYDARGRLISEVRTGDNAYDLAYEYDQGGNRTLKTQSFSSTHWLEVRYTYDISDPVGFGTAANRLMRTETYDVTVASVLGKMKAQAAAFGPTETLLESTWYSYNGSGNVTLMSTSVANPAEGEPNYFETVFSYARNEKAVTAISGTTPGSGGNPPTSFARGFRYDAARERYRNNETWSDYDQDWIYGDYLVDPTTGEVTEKRAYMPGIARVEDIDAPGTPPVRYYHTDMLGTTRFVTTLSGQPTDETVYTAFGEKVCSLPGGDCTNTTDHRYGYAGAFGYQSTINDTTGVADFPFLHVGARYYDPAIGRFLQRDPIGIEGGLNVYAYVRNGPTKRIDPSGLSTNNPGGAGSHTPGGMKEVIETVKDMGDFGGRKINGYTKHAINQAICRGGKGVATKAILEAIKSGVWQAGKNGTAKYVGKFATLIMRGDGTIITVYATCAEGARIKGG